MGLCLLPISHPPATRNPLWDLPYGANSQGVFGACPPELLHQWLLGIAKYAIVFTWALVKDCARTQGKQFNTFTAELDRRISCFNGVRHADPHLPKKQFRTGVFELLSYLEAKEYRALLLYQVYF